MKFIKYNTPKNKIQHVKNELKHRINVSNNAELYNIQKTFAYLPVLSNDIDDDFDLEKEVAKVAQPQRKIEKEEPKSSIVDDDDLEEFKRLLQDM